MHEGAAISTEDNPKEGLEQAVEEAYASTQRKPRPVNGAIILLTLILILGGLMLVSEQTGLTGMITGPDGEEQALDTDIIIDGTERISLEELGLENITSLKVTGETEADKLEIALETPEGTRLVYSHESRGNLITGNVAGAETNVTAEKDGNETAEEPTNTTDENKSENQAGRQENTTARTNPINPTDNRTGAEEPAITNETATNKTTSQDNNQTNTTLNETADQGSNETANLTPTTSNGTDQTSHNKTTQVPENKTQSDNLAANQSVNETTTSRTDEDNLTGLQPETTNETGNETRNTTTTKTRKTFVEACVDTCTHQPITEGTLVITSEGETTITSITYTTATEEKKALNQTTPIKDVTLEPEEETTIDLDEQFTGATYYDQPSTKSVKTEIEDGQLTITAQKEGTYNHQVYATDGDELIRSNEFTITVESYEDQENKTQQPAANTKRIRLDEKTITIPEEAAGKAREEVYDKLRKDSEKKVRVLIKT
ncbi:hypothetical protein KY327_02260, partial [Candidatus Woesearchaeota archaeon]|nr:hypothetical protein [Candidatus Woesearchaeota archaeon]